MDTIDGVRFAFNMQVFSVLPAKIRIYQRAYNSSGPWQQIGQITDCDQIDGIKFVRGSAVWLPSAPGDYEVQAAAVNSSGTVIASAVRHVVVGTNQPPVVTIAGGPPTPSASAQPAVFTAQVTDPDGDTIRRVEFYDNGVLIGTDTTSSETSPGVFTFGNDIKDIEGNLHNLLRGTHNITAKAFDSKRASGQTASASQFVITGGNARPTIDVSSPASGLVVTQGQSFTISYTEGDPDGAADIHTVEAYNIATQVGVVDATPPYDDLTMSTSGWQPGTHTIRVLTRDDSGAASYPFYLKIVVRTGSGPTFAETLVARIVDEQTAAPTNSVFTGVVASSGLFDQGIASGLDINSGALLTSGSFALWNGGDDSLDQEWMDEEMDPQFGQDSVEPGDPGLQDRVSGNSTFDAAALEFDVNCSYGQLELVFQFGSEEYLEYVGEYNDGFMATVDGVLVSLVPDGSGIVAVNTVHAQSTGQPPRPPINEHLYLDDDLDIDPRVAPVNQPVQVEYDGVTIRLKAHVFITPSSTRRVKLVIGDVNDDYYDSGLFIEESSVKTISPQP